MSSTINWFTLLLPTNSVGKLYRKSAYQDNPPHQLPTEKAAVDMGGNVMVGRLMGYVFSTKFLPQCMTLPTLHYVT